VLGYWLPRVNIDYISKWMCGVTFGFVELYYRSNGGYLYWK